MKHSWPLQAIADVDTPYMLLLDAPAFALPETVDEALAARQRRPGAAWVAGGTELMPDMLWRRTAPVGLVSLRRLDELRTVTRGDVTRGDVTRGDVVRIGAGVRIADLERWAADVPGLAAAAASLGTPLVRVEATIGGNVMSARPYRNLLPSLLALGAELEVTSASGIRRTPFAGFITAPGRTTLGPDELLTAVLVPPLHGFQDYVKVGPRNAQFVATASAAIVVDRDTRAVRFGFGNAGPVPVAVPAADSVASAAMDWDGGSAMSGAALDEVAEAVRAGVDPPEDAVASAAYRRHALGVLARRLLTRAAAAAGGDR